MVIEMCGTCKWYSAKTIDGFFEVKCRKHRKPTTTNMLAVIMDCKDWEPTEGEWKA